LLGDSDVRPYLAQAMAAFRQTRDVSTFDMYIDRFALGKLVEALAPDKSRLRRLYDRPDAVVRSMVAADVDSFDILAVLRSKWLDLPENKARELLIIPAFFIDEHALEAMLSASSVQAAANVLSHTVYRRMLPSASSPEALISGVEDAFFRRTLTTARRSFSSQPMSEPILLGALKAKEVEVRNLSSIAFGVEVGLEPSAIIAKLIS
jgi:V/A-type H+-transporting ATPase subunit C